MRHLRKLSRPEQDAFAREILADLNGTEAALQMQRDPSEARRFASNLLRTTTVLETISETLVRRGSQTVGFGRLVRKIITRSVPVRKGRLYFLQATVARTGLTRNVTVSPGEDFAADIPSSQAPFRQLSRRWTITGRPQRGSGRYPHFGILDRSCDGYELDVFRGGRELITHSRPFNPLAKEVRGARLEFLRYLARLGGIFYVYAEDATFLETMTDPDHLWDVFRSLKRHYGYLDVHAAPSV